MQSSKKICLFTTESKVTHSKPAEQEPNRTTGIPTQPGEHSLGDRFASMLYLGTLIINIPTIVGIVFSS